MPHCEIFPIVLEAVVAVYWQWAKVNGSGNAQWVTFVIGYVSTVAECKESGGGVHAFWWLVVWLSGKAQGGRKPK